MLLVRDSLQARSSQSCGRCRRLLPRAGFRIKQQPVSKPVPCRALAKIGSGFNRDRLDHRQVEMLFDGGDLGWCFAAVKLQHVGLGGGNERGQRIAGHIDRQQHREGLSAPLSQAASRAS